MKNLTNLFYSFGEFIGWIIGVILMIADIIEKGLNWGLITNDVTFQIGFILFIGACVWSVFKANKKARDAKDKLEKYKREVDTSAGRDKFEIDQKDNNLAIGNMTGNVLLPDVKKKKI